MRKTLLLTAVAAASIATPAMARDGSGYVGLEAGVMFPKDNNADVFANFTTTTTPVTPPLPPGTVVPAGPADTTFSNMFGVDYKTGYDVDLIGGYDFGFFRLEAELGYKRAGLDSLEVDSGDIAALNTALNRPDNDVAPEPVGTLTPLVATDFDLDGHVSVLSGMVNALLDVGGNGGVGGYIGGGFGRARVKLLGDSDSAWAWQAIAGVYYPISSNIDIGLKYRYFRTGKLNLNNDFATAIAGNADRINVGTALAPVFVDQTTTADLFTDFSDHFSSHSLLASLVFNFGAAAAEPPPPPPLPPPPPPEAPPQTQTCPDGSVILATSACPPPPPPPPPPVERGERGR